MSLRWPASISSFFLPTMRSSIPDKIPMTSAASRDSRKAMKKIAGANTLLPVDAMMGSLVYRLARDTIAFIVSIVNFSSKTLKCAARVFVSIDYAI